MSLADALESGNSKTLQYNQNARFKLTPICTSLMPRRSTQSDPCEDGVVVQSGEDVVPPGAPHVHPHPVFCGELHHTADAGHLAAFVRQRGVIHRHQLRFVLDDGALCTPVCGRVQGEVVEALLGAGEDACFIVVTASLVEHHGGELEDPGRTGVAVAHCQLGCEGHSA